MKSNKQIIFFELNEVPYKIFERYSKKSKGFSRLISYFKKYDTYSYDDVHLSPWITWPTVHRGATFSKHRIQNLGQDIKNANIDYPPIWECLRRKKISVGVYGSLHSSKFEGEIKDYDFYVPDIFSSNSFAHPISLKPIQDFQLKLSRKSARNVHKGIGGISSIKIFFSLIRNGLTLKTIFKIIGQLLKEKIRKKYLSRRRIIHTDINFDIFFKLLKNKNPSFSTFFTNHVASSMHRYWEASYPNDYEVQIQSLDWIKKYKEEINISMRTTERILKKLLNYSKSRPNCELWICTSMGQKPVNNYESISSQLIIEDFAKFLSFFSLEPNNYSIKPTMMPRFTFETTSEKDLKLLEDNIKNLKINNKKFEYMILGNSLTIRLMHWNYNPLISFKNKEIRLIENLGLKMIKIEDNSGTSAYHTPEGCLMIYGKENNNFKRFGTIPTDQIKNLIEKSFDH